MIFTTTLVMRLPWARARNHKRERFPLTYRRIRIEDWQGMQPGEHLSLDWDFPEIGHASVTRKFGYTRKKSE